MARGWFITFEGGEGTGKSTQMERLERWLSGRGFEVLTTREPGGTPLAEAIRSVLLDPGHAPDGLAEIFLLEAARHDHVEGVVRPALARGAVVLCDRFADSSLVYQGQARGVGWDVVARLNELATAGLEPDLTLVFDMEPGSAVGRARNRNTESTLHETRFDDESEAFHDLVRRGYQELARRFPDRVRVVDAAGDPDAVFVRVIDTLPAELR
jgi:dTMP kinase